MRGARWRMAARVLRFDGVAEAGGEADGAEQAELVFVEAAMGIADGADDAGIEIGQAADVIEESCADGGRLQILDGPKLCGIEQQAVDGEVAALDVFGGIGGVANLVGMAAVGVDAVAAEGGNLGDGVARGRVGRVFERRCFVEGLVGDQDDAEGCADGEGAWEEPEDDVGRGGGGHVVVERSAAEEQVADAAAGEVGLVALGAQGFDDAERGFELAREGGHLALLSSTPRAEMQVVAGRLEGDEKRPDSRH